MQESKKLPRSGDDCCFIEGKSLSYNRSLVVSQLFYDKLKLEVFGFVFSFFHQKKKKQKILVAANAQLQAITHIPMLRHQPPPSSNVFLDVDRGTLTKFNLSILT